MAVVDTLLPQDSPAWSPTPIDLLAAPAIPTKAHFVRDHFPVPVVDRRTWSLTIEGQRSLELSLGELRWRPAIALRVVLECAGHRRTEFDPLPPGLPWGAGAVGEAEWTGVPLAGLLKEVGIPRNASYVVLEGADSGEYPGVAGEHRFARALPIDKALHGDVILAWAMNREPIPDERGGPIRAIVPGWYATDSIKWLTCIRFADGPFDGLFEALDYRFRIPGRAGPGVRMTELPVSSLITTPLGDDSAPAGHSVVRGIAWGGRGGVARVQVRIDDGLWHHASLTPARGPYERTVWALRCELAAGRRVLASRAFDRDGNAQPLAPVANLCGYGNNAVHRVEVDVRRC